MSYRPYLFGAQIPPTQHTQAPLPQHTQHPLPPPWHQQHGQLHIALQKQQQQQLSIYRAQPPPLAQNLITYWTGVAAKSEPLSPQTPSSTSKSPAPVPEMPTTPMTE